MSFEQECIKAAEQSQSIIGLIEFGAENCRKNIINIIQETKDSCGTEEGKILCELILIKIDERLK